MKAKTDLREVVIKRVPKKPPDPGPVDIGFDVTVRLKKPTRKSVRVEAKVEVEMKARESEKLIMRSNFLYNVKCEIEKDLAQEMRECFEKNKSPPTAFNRMLVSILMKKVLRILFTFSEMMHIPSVLTIPTGEELADLGLIKESFRGKISKHRTTKT